MLSYSTINPDDRIIVYCSHTTTYCITPHPTTTLFMGAVSRSNVVFWRNTDRLLPPAIASPLADKFCGVIWGIGRGGTTGHVPLPAPGSAPPRPSAASLGRAHVLLYRVREIIYAPPSLDPRPSRPTLSVYRHVQSRSRPLCAVRRMCRQPCLRTAIHRALCIDHLDPPPGATPSSTPLPPRPRGW